MRLDMRLFVTDLDGTLLRNDATLSAYSVESLNKLIDQGMLFTISTARSFQTVSRLLEGVRLRLPCIIFNGVYLVDPTSQKCLVSNLINYQLLDSLLGSSTEYGISPFLFGKQDGNEMLLHTVPQNEGQQLFLKHRPGDKRLRLVKTINSLEQNITLNFIARREELLPLKEWAEEKYGDQLRIYFAEDVYLSGFYTLEFYHSEADKGIMLRKLAKLVGVSLSQVTVFGDNLNDQGMFNVAGYRIAVSNAHQDLLMKADQVIGSNNDDGVVHYLDQFFHNHIKKEWED